MIQKSVDGGQLFWVSLGMLASTGYDAFTGYTSRPEQQEFAAWAMGLCIGGAFFCAIFIAISASRASQQQRIPIAVIWLSALAVVLMCYCYPLVHFRLA
nr:hypothetical protein [uncultured Duganella sp.]